MRRHYSDPAAYAEAAEAVYRGFHPDVLFSPFALTAEGEAFGSQVLVLAGQAPTLIRPAIGSIDEIAHLAVPDVDSHPRLVYIRQAVEMIVAAQGKEVPLAGILLSPMSLPALIMGLENWLETFLMDEKGCRRMLDITTSFFVRWANALLGAGASFLLVPAMFANPNIVTRELAVSIVRPVWEAAFARVNGPLILHHGSNPMVPFLDLFKDLPNVAGFVVDPADDLAEARRIVGPEKLLLGGIDGPTLMNHSPEEIRERCTRVLEDRCDDPRFILATTAADIDFLTPPENIHAIREAAERFASGAVHAG